MQSAVTEGATPLARLIREQGRLKSWVAEQLGCGRDRVTRLASGEARMTIEEGVALARLFDVPVETFVRSEAER